MNFLLSRSPHSAILLAPFFHRLRLPARLVPDRFEWVRTGRYVTQDNMVQPLPHSGFAGVRGKLLLRGRPEAPPIQSRPGQGCQGICRSACIHAH